MIKQTKFKIPLGELSFLHKLIYSQIYNPTKNKEQNLVDFWNYFGQNPLLLRINGTQPEKLTIYFNETWILELQLEVKESRIIES